jgi:hypothetical protein
MDGDDQGRIPTSYKAWVFGGKLAGVLIFAVGIEMLTRGEPLWAALLLLAGAAVVLAPVRSPEGWDRRTGRRV